MRIAHQARLIVHDFRKHARERGMVHRFAVKHDADLPLGGREAPLVEAANLHGRVHKRVVVGGLIAWFRRRLGSLVAQFLGNAPAQGQIAELHCRVFAAAFGNIAEDHGEIDESVLGVELRIERAGIVPETRVLDANLALAPGETFDAPGFFIKAAHQQRVAGCVGGAEIADAISEVTNLVKRVPCRHPHHDTALHAGDDHSHAKLVLRGMRERYFVANRRPCRRGP